MRSIQPGGCYLCHVPLGADHLREGSNRDVWEIVCNTCGPYVCTDDVVEALVNLSEHKRAQLSGVICEQRERRQPRPEITTVNLAALLSTAPYPFDVSAKVRKLLSALARRTKTPGDKATPMPRPHADFPLAYATGGVEFLYLLFYAKDCGWIEDTPMDDCRQVVLTPAGWEEVQRRPRIESPVGFVAMWFDSSMDDAYKYGIRAALEDDCGFQSRRIDFKEFNEDIVFELMSEIRQARFVVAELTGQRNGVYFEAGFARGLDIPVIYCCHKGHLKDIHFDIAHDKRIEWESPDELRKSLESRILGTIGPGPMSLQANG